MRKYIGLLALALTLTACANNKENTEETKPKLTAVEDDSTNDENSTNQEEVGQEENKEESKEETKEKSIDGKLVKNQINIYDYFDTITSFIAYTESDEEFDRLVGILEEELSIYHKLYNSYDEFEGVNNFYTINQNAGIKPVKVDKAIIDLTKYSKEMYKLTDGKIDIAMGSLLGLWHDFREMSINNPDKAAIPAEDDLVKASKHKDIDAIEIDEENSTVYINDKDVKIDIGAIGKGYATKIIGEKLKESGLKHGILSVGGDDMLIGDNPGAENSYYKIAIQNPDLEDKDNPYSAVVSLKNTSVVTSGDYQRYFVVDGKRYHHIIDPATLYPSTNWTSVSVILDDIALADTISTYLFILDYENGLKFAKENNCEVMWIDHEGNQFKTEGWPES